MESNDTIKKVNEMLEYISIPLQISSYAELVTSLWIILFERILKTKLVPKYRNLDYQSRVTNLQTLLSALQNVVRSPLWHFKPEMIIAGDHVSLRNLCLVFWELYRQIKSIENLGKNKIEMDISAIIPIGIPNQSMYEDVSGNDNDDVIRSREKMGEERGSLVQNKSLGDIEENSLNMRNTINSNRDQEYQVVTPYLKELVLRRAKIQAEIENEMQKQPDQISNRFKTELGNHYKSSHFKDSRVKFVESHMEEIEVESELEYAENEVKDAHKVESIPEANLANFIDRIIKKAPILRKIPMSETKKAWNDQLKTWGRALDDRVWSRKVAAHKESTLAVQTKKVNYHNKQVTRQKLVVCLQLI